MEGGDDLSAWPRARLKRLCCDAGLNEDGTKKELVKRLRNASDVLSTIKQRESTQRESSSEDKPAVLAEDGTDITQLVALVRDGNAAQKESAAESLRKIAATCADNQIAIAEAGGIPPLVALIRDGNAAQKEHAAWALECLAHLCADNQVLIAEAGGIPPLVALVRDGGDLRFNSTLALRSLTSTEPHRLNRNQVAIAKALVALVCDGTAKQKENASDALEVLATAGCAEYSHLQVVKYSHLQVVIAKALVAKVRDGTDAQQEHAATALRNLADNCADNREAIIPPLVALIRDGTDAQKAS